MYDILCSFRQRIARSLYSVIRPRMLKHLDELNRLQWLGEDEQITLQYKRLQQVLEYANTYVPYYRDLFRKIGFQPPDFVADPTNIGTIIISLAGDENVEIDRLAAGDSFWRETSFNLSELQARSTSSGDKLFIRW